LRLEFSGFAFDDKFSWWAIGAGGALGIRPNWAAVTAHGNVGAKALTLPMQYSGGRLPWGIVLSSNAHGSLHILPRQRRS
jgi:hypothetical protein